MATWGLFGPPAVAGAVMAVFGAPSASASLVTFDGLEAQSYGYAETYAGPPQTGYSSYTSSGSASASTLSDAEAGIDATSTAYSTSSNTTGNTTINGPVTASANEQTLAGLTGPSSGYFDFSSTTNASVPANAPDGGAYAEDDGSFTDYDYVLSSNARIDIAWNNNDLNSAQYGYEIYVYCDYAASCGGGDWYSQWAPAGAVSGSVTVAISAGYGSVQVYQNYTTDDVFQGGAGSVTSGASGNFEFRIAAVPDEFSIAAVPEASTWAMLSAGFAGLGLVRFSRRKSARYTF